MSDTVELELKFTVPESQRAAIKRDLLRDNARSHRLRAIYFDTADNRLLANGISIRLRNEDGQWLQTIKVLTADPVRRVEHSVLVDSARGGRRPALDLQRHGDTAAGTALCAAVAGQGLESPNPLLIEHVRTDVTRLTLNEQVGESDVELAFDIGTVSCGERSVAICELEFELKTGTVADLIALSCSWVARYGLVRATVSKSERGARLATGVLQQRPVGAVKPLINASAGMAAFRIAALEACLAQTNANAGELEFGAVDEQTVHELRVGLRRLRTALRELSGFGPALDPSWDPILRHTFRELGLHRDQVTVLPTIAREMSADGVDWVGQTTSVSKLASPLTVARATPFQWTLLAILGYCHAPPPPFRRNKDSPKNLIRQLARRLDRLHAKLARDATSFETLPTARQHSVRKRAKRLRYLSEFAGTLFDPDRVAHYLAGWRQAQDALGEYNDQRISRQALKAQGLTNKCTRAARQWFDERLARRVRRCTKALRQATKKRVFWRH